MELVIKVICTLLIFTIYKVMVMVQAPSLDDRPCSPGKYRASTGICCNLCMAGTFVIGECRSNGEDSICTFCDDGITFTEEANYLKECNKCSSCSADEEQVLPCASSRNTICQCKEGYYRAQYSKKCTKTNPESAYVGGLLVTILIFIIGVLFISLVLLSYYVYRQKTRGDTQKRNDSVQLDGEAIPLLEDVSNVGPATTSQKRIAKNKKMLQWSISKNPQHLLDELDRKGTISRKFYNETKCMPVSSDCAANLIQHFQNNGETACQNFLDALYATKDKYPDLTEWLERKSFVVVEGRNVRLIRENKLHLKQWINTDSDNLVEELDEKGFIPKHVCNQVKEKQNCLEVTGVLLDYILDCGDDKCEEFLKVLRAVSKCPKVNKWLNILDMEADLYTEETVTSQDGKARIVVVDGNALHMIRGKKPQLKQWISSDASRFLDELKTRRHISEHVSSKAAGLSTPVEQAGFLLDHFIDGGEKKCQNLLETLQDLNETYPKVDKWLDSLENNSQIVVVKEGTRQKVIDSRKILMEWIAKDPSILLDELDSKWYIKRHIYNTARDIEDKKECAAFILEHFISGEEEYQKLLVALKAVRKHYDKKLHDWLSDQGLIREPNNKNVEAQEKKIVVVPGNAKHIIRGKKPDLKSWTAGGASPSGLMDALKTKGHISEHVYSKAKKFPNPAEQAGFLLDHFIDGGEKKCQKLLETLQELKDTYPGVRDWLSSLETKQDIVLMKKGAQDIIVNHREDLIRWIAKDPWILLDELDSKWYIQRPVYNTAKDIEDKTECATFILEHFISGEEEYQKLLVALKAVRKHYDKELDDWLDSLECTSPLVTTITKDQPSASPISKQAAIFKFQ